MFRLIRYAHDKVLKLLQRGCGHPGEFVTADILEGDQEPMLVIKWCKRCGALMFINEPAREYWRLPDPDFVRDLRRDLRRADYPHSD